MKQLLLLLFTFLAIDNMQAQDQFERLYRATGREFLGMDVRQTSSGGYLLLSIVRNETNEELEQVNVTSVDPKGDIGWSKDYDFEETLERTGDLLLLENDSFLFTVVLTESEMNKVVVKAAPNGDIVWANGYGNPDFVPLNVPVIAESDVTQNPDRGYSIFGQQGVGNESGIYGARLDSMGNIMWAKNYFIDDIDPMVLNGIQDAQVTQDSGFILTGRTSEFAASANAMLVKLDSLGNVIWANEYGLGGVFEAHLGEAVVQTADLGYVVAGFETVGDFPPSTNGIVFKTDSLGEILWINSINIDSSFLTDSRFTDVDLTEEGNIIVSGFARELSAPAGYALSMTFDQLGNVIADQRYSQDISIAEDIAITATQNNGLAIFNSFLEQDGSTIPYLIKGDEMGASSCSDTLVYLIDQLDTLPTNPLVFLIEDLDTMLLKEPMVMNYDSFSVPVLALIPPPPFCEGDPINVTFDATVDGAVSYEWSTGETTPMITVMEEGLYTVDVRVEEDVCFNLCDTVVISTTGPPMVAIGQDLTPFCTDGVGVLEAQIQGFANQIEWSTGETESIIFIDQPGTYSVTVTNPCGSSESQVVVNEFPEVLPSFSLMPDASEICNGGEGIIVATIFNADPNTIMWTASDGGEIISGETSSVITIGNTGTYTISASNNCGTGTMNSVISADLPTVNIEVINNNICVTDTAEITFNSTNAELFTWSTGEMGDIGSNQQITVTGQNTYSVTVSNTCGDTATDAVTFDCEFPFDECLLIPNAFTPNNDDTNDEFSPVIPEECATGITIRRLTIWSRWGKKVFDEESSNPIWDGMDGGEPAGADVYIYLVDAVNDNGEERVLKGDVTLIR